MTGNGTVTAARHNSHDTHRTTDKVISDRGENDGIVALFRLRNLRLLSRRKTSFHIIDLKTRRCTKMSLLVGSRDGHEA